MSVRHNGTVQSDITRAVKGGDVHNFSVAFEYVLISHPRMCKNAELNSIFGNVSKYVKRGSVQSHVGVRQITYTSG